MAPSKERPTGTRSHCRSSAADAGLDPLEKNGFTIIDFTEDRIEGQMFSWKMDEPEERLDDLKPFHTFTAVRRM